MRLRRNTQYPHLPHNIEIYAESRSLDYDRYSPYHLRLMDGGYTILDIWTTGRYWVMATDYHEMLDGKKIVERGGEKGTLPGLDDVDILFAWLDKLFFPEEGHNG